MKILFKSGLLCSAKWLFIAQAESTNLFSVEQDLWVVLLSCIKMNYVFAVISGCWQRGKKIHFENERTSFVRSLVKRFGEFGKVLKTRWQTRKRWKLWNLLKTKASFRLVETLLCRLFLKIKQTFLTFFKMVS